VVQLRDGVGLALKSPLRVRVVSRFVGEKLQGDFTPQAHIFGFIHDPHAATAELPGNAVVTDCLSEHRAF
jgi:hypothetical protein